MKRIRRAAADYFYSMRVSEINKATHLGCLIDFVKSRFLHGELKTQPQRGVSVLSAQSV